MNRRTFINGSIVAAGIGMAGCIGGDDNGEEQCLPEDGSDFLRWDDDQILHWAPSDDGFEIVVPRSPTQPAADQREDRDPQLRTHWLDLTYEDDDENLYMLSASRFNEPEGATEYASTAEPGQIAPLSGGLVDAPTAITGARDLWAYRVLAESEDLTDEAETLFLNIPCVEEEHILDRTW